MDVERILDAIDQMIDMDPLKLRNALQDIVLECDRVFKYEAPREHQTSERVIAIVMSRLGIET